MGRVVEASRAPALAARDYRSSYGRPARWQMRLVEADSVIKNTKQRPLWETGAHDVDPVKKGARKLAGTKPAHPPRDPAKITRKRKAITR